MWVPAHDSRLQGLFTNGSAVSFHKGDGAMLAGVVTFALALAPFAFAYARQNAWRCDPKVNAGRVSQLLKHQLRPAQCQRLPVQATGMFQHEVATDACT